MSLHPRAPIVEAAGTEISDAIEAIRKRHRLTLPELLSVIGQLQEFYTLTLLRYERHPNDPGKPADEE